MFEEVTALKRFAKDRVLPLYNIAEWTQTMLWRSIILVLAEVLLVAIAVSGPTGELGTGFIAGAWFAAVLSPLFLLGFMIRCALERRAALVVAACLAMFTWAPGLYSVTTPLWRHLAAPVPVGAMDVFLFGAAAGGGLTIELLLWGVKLFEPAGALVAGSVGWMLRAREGALARRLSGGGSKKCSG